MTRTCLSVLLSCGSLLLNPVWVYAETYPVKPVRIVAAGSAGGGGDFVARVLAAGLSPGLGQPVVVDNRPAVIATETVAKAPPDGYTILVFSNSLWMAPFLEDVTYDPVRDFSPIAVSNRAPNILVVHPSIPAKSVKELISIAKAKPGTLDYATAETGGSAHLAGELFKAMAGVNIVRIPYKSTTPALTELIAGQVHMMFGNASVAPAIKSGRLRALAVSTAEPSALYPGLPTVAAAGLPGFESSSIHVVFAPAKTPAAVISRLNQEIAKTLATADVKEKFANFGAETVGGTPDILAATMKSEMARVGKLVKDAGLRAN